MTEVLDDWGIRWLKLLKAEVLKAEVLKADALKAIIVSILPERLFHFVGGLSSRRLKTAVERLQS